MVRISDISPTDLQVRSNIEQHNIMIGSINEVIEEVNAIGPGTIKEDIVNLKNDVSDHETRIINNERVNVEQNGLIARNRADIVTNESAIDTLKTTTDYALVNVGFEGDGDGVTAKESQINGGIKENALPIADAGISGIMNSSTFRSVSDAIRRIETLEGRQGTYFVVLPNDTPTQEEITIAYLMAYPSAPNPPVGGTGLRDIAKSKTFIYNGTAWVETSDRELPVFGLGTEGLIKGSNTDGQVFAEPNGEGSVKGWSEVKTDIANMKTDVVTAQNTADVGITKSGTNATEIIGLKARVAVIENGKIDKNQGSGNAGLTFKVGDNGNVELVPFPDVTPEFYLFPDMTALIFTSGLTSISSSVTKRFGYYTEVEEIITNKNKLVRYIRKEPGNYVGSTSLNRQLTPGTVFTSGVIIATGFPYFDKEIPDYQRMYTGKLSIEATPQMTVNNYYVWTLDYSLKADLDIVNGELISLKITSMEAIPCANSGTAKLVITKVTMID